MYNYLGQKSKMLIYYSNSDHLYSIESWKKLNLNLKSAMAKKNYKEGAKTIMEKKWPNGKMAL